MIRDVSISSRTGYAYSTKRECLKDGFAILATMSFLFILIWSLVFFSNML